MSKLDDFRKEKDDFFKSSPDSPLTGEQKNSFQGLNYYLENPDLIFDLSLEKNLDGEKIVSLQTSSADTEPFARYAKINFEVNGKKVSLTIFKDLEGSSLFLPFKDLTSNKETYSSGRYVEVEEDKGKVHLDFNYAYNPNCAYNEHWRCPLTPAENRLEVPIEAGEKKFHN